MDEADVADFQSSVVSQTITVENANNENLEDLMNQLKSM